MEAFAQNTLAMTLPCITLNSKIHSLILVVSRAREALWGMTNHLDVRVYLRHIKKIILNIF